MQEKKQKKIKYGNISKKALNTIIGDDFFVGEYTLKQDLDRQGEDIIYADYSITKGKFDYFNAWSKDRVFFLCEGFGGSSYLLGFSRSPEIYKKRKQKGL